MTAFTAEAAARLPGPEWMQERRAAAAERFADSGLPTEAEEVWRYSRISELDLDAYTLATHSAHVEAPDGVVITQLDDAPDGDEVLGSVAASSTDAFTELGTAFVTGGLIVDVPRGVVVEQPITIVHEVNADGSAVFPRTIVRLGESAQVTVVEHHRSADVAAFVGPVVELDVGAAARLSYTVVQELGPRVWQTAYQASRVGRDAELRSAAVALGGDYARLRTDSRLEGQGATSYLLAVYFGAGSGMHDFRTMQDHVAPATTSDLLFKGAVAGTAKSVYSGLIRVRKEARGTNAFQTNRNLVLSEGAGAESVPNLEIETNDVRCSHASAVGPIDEDQRYYLESRGIPPQIAERLIVIGFFTEVLERLPVPALAAALGQELTSRLEAAR